MKTRAIELPIYVTNAQMSFRGHIQRGDLGRATQQLAILEKHGRHFSGREHEIAGMYADAADLSLGLKKHLQTFELASKSLRWAKGEARPRASFILGLISEECSKDGILLQQLQPRYRSLFERTVRPIIPTLTLAESMHWFSIIDKVLQNEFLVEQVQLAERIIPLMDPGSARVEVAARHLERATQLETFQGHKIDREKAADSARLMIAEGRSLIAKFSEDQFMWFIASLEQLDLVDSLSAAQSLCRLPAESPCRYYLKLAFLYRTDLEAAIVEVRANHGRFDQLPDEVREKIVELHVKVINRYLMAHQVDQATVTEESPASNWYEKFMRQPAKLDTAFYQELKSHLIRLLAAHNHFAVEYKPLHMRIEPGERMKSLRGEAYIIYLPTDGELAVYLGSEEKNQWLKVAFKVRQIDGKPAFIAEPVVLVAGEKVGLTVRTMMDLNNFLSLMLPDGKRGAVHSLATKVTAEMSRAIGRFFAGQTAISFDQFTQKLEADISVLNQAVDVHNRLLLARTIFETYLKDPIEELYELRRDDALFPIVKDLEFVRLDTARKFLATIGQESLLSPKEGKYPLVVNLQPRDEGLEAIFVIVESPKKIIIPGRGQISGQAAEYLFDLIYEAAVKLSIKSSIDALRQTGYLFQPGEEVGPEGSLGQLRTIYSHYFNQQLAQGGLYAFPWFTYERVGQDDGLFRPLPNQERAAKEKLISAGKADTLFVQMQPTGLIMTLPVRYKKVQGKLQLAPWERQPLREQQQALMGDPRVLPNFFGLYILTYFSDFSGHAFRYVIKTTEEEVLDDSLLADAEEKLQSQFFRDPLVFLRGTPARTRKQIAAALAEGRLTIEQQEIQAFRVNTTFKRPEMKLLAALMEEGTPL